MNQITISESEYITLKNHFDAYKKLVSNLFSSIIADPINEVVEDFKNTNLYTDNFIKDLESGLRKSSYANKSN